MRVNYYLGLPRSVSYLLGVSETAATVIIVGCIDLAIATVAVAMGFFGYVDRVVNALLNRLEQRHEHRD